jgi:uncharacterized protein YcaQ
MTAVRHISPEAAARFLVSHHGLAQQRPEPTPEAACRALLAERRCIQLDPLDMIGQNADLVAMARIDGLSRGDVYRHLLPGHAFEHFAKERCLLPASAFPWYRAHIAETDWWSLKSRTERLPKGIVQEVLALVEAHGPVNAATLDQLGGFGRVKPMDWSGWKGTARTSAMALEVLWTRCEVVVASREKRGKLWDVPRRTLPDHHRAVRGNKREREAFLEWSLIERVHAAGLLARASGPHWSMLAEARTGELPDRLVAEGRLEEVFIDGARRPYLAPAGALDAELAEPDARMRILGPLDSVVWDRKLVQHAFGFEYVWEVYKPAAQRRWGYYVCPLMHRGQLVGRFEARVEDGRLDIIGLWKEPGRRFDTRAYKRALSRHEAMM